MRYVGPVDGHDIAELEHGAAQRRRAVRPRARSSSTSSPRRAAATRRPRTTTRSTSTTPRCSTRSSARPRRCRPGYTQAFAEAIIKEAEADDRIVAITAAMAGPDRPAAVPGPLPRPLLRRRHRRAARRHRRRPAWRWAGCARSSPSTRRSSTGRGTRSSTTSPCTACRSCSASTGPASPAPTAPSHHGVYDMALLSQGARACGCSRRRAPRSCTQMLHDAMSLADDGPVAIRYPRGAARNVDRARGRRRAAAPANACRHRRRRRRVHPRRRQAASASAEKAADRRSTPTGIDATVWDVRCCAPLDPDDDRRRRRATASSSPSRTASATAASA